MFNSRLKGADGLFILSLAFIIGIFILGFNPRAFRQTPKPSDLAFHNGEKITFQARVCEEADLSLYNRRLTLCAPGRVLVTTDLYPVYDYGDYLEVSGLLQTPPEFESFDYERYLARHDIYSIMYYPHLKLLTPLDSPLSQKMYAALLNFKQALRAIINRSLPEPEASLANALLLGYRRGLTKEANNIFARVGLSHIVAISGTHITILSALIVNFWLALGLKRRQAILLVIIFLATYPLLTGLSASAVRASLMGGLAFVAAFYQRLGSLHRALAFAAALMLAFNPLLLRADIGFQLSFLAILGIIYIYPGGEKLTQSLISAWRLKHDLRKIFSAVFGAANLSIAAQIVTLPIVVINFRQLSLIAPLANVLLVWTLPWVLASLVGGLLLAVIFPGPDYLFFTPAYILLKTIFFLATYLSSFSWAAIAIEKFSYYLAVIYYLFLWGLVLILRKKFNYDAGSSKR